MASHLGLPLVVAGVAHRSQKSHSELRILFKNRVDGFLPAVPCASVFLDIASVVPERPGRPIPVENVMRAELFYIPHSKRSFSAKDSLQKSS